MRNSLQGRRTRWQRSYPLVLFLVLVCLVILLLNASVLPPAWQDACLHLCLLLFCIDCVLFHLAWRTGQPVSLSYPQRGGGTTGTTTPADLLPMTSSALLRLNPTEFEEFIGIVLEAMGMEYTHIQRIGGSGDHGADLYARNTFGLPIIVQCKRYAADNHVDSPDMQRFLGSVVHYRAAYGWFITTSSFTEPARRFAAMHSERIRLLDGEQLLALLLQRQLEVSLVWQRRRRGQP